MDVGAGVGVFWLLGFRVFATLGLPEGEFGAGMPNLEGAEVVHKIPGILGFDDVGERRHRRTVETGHEDTVEILVRGAALKAIVGVEIVGLDGLVSGVGKRGSGRAITAAFLAVTLPTFEFLVELLAVFHAFERELRFGRNVDGRSGFVGGPAAGKRFDKCHEVSTLLGGQRDTRRHGGSDETAFDGGVEIGRASCRERV